MERNQRWPTSSPDLLPRAQSRTRGGTQKFLVSRFAEICLLLALGLIYLDVGSLSLQEIHFALNAQDSLPLSLTGAALLLAFAAILKPPSYLCTAG